jgi:uncharacterized protein (DUF2384 family)
MMAPFQACTAILILSRHHFMSNDEQLTPASMAALQARFQQQSRKAQAYYTVMNEIRRLVGNDDAASNWMEQPLAEFGGQTPSQAVSTGREQEVLDHISAMRPGSRK